MSDDRLADEKLTAAADALRARGEFAEIRVASSAYPSYSEIYGLRRLDAEPDPLPEADAARCQAIETELAAIEEAADAADGDEARIEALEKSSGA